MKGNNGKMTKMMLMIIPQPTTTKRTPLGFKSKLDSNPNKG